jgi:hypothetical protein
MSIYQPFLSVQALYFACFTGLIFHCLSMAFFLPFLMDTRRNAWQ